MNSPVDRDLAAIDRRIDQRVGKQIVIGIAEVVTPDKRSAKVRMAGSKTLTDVAIMRGAEVSPGDSVVLVRPAGSEAWVCLGAYIRRVVNSLGVGSVFSSPLHPPSNVSAIGGKGMLICYWEAPPQRPDLVFLVQATDTTDVNWESASTYIRCGSYLLLFVAPGTTKMFRVKSIDSKWNRSGWSPITQATAAGAIPVGLEEDRPADPHGEYFAVDTDLLFIGDGSAWHTVSASGVVAATELDDLSDVDLSTPPTDGQALVFDDSSGMWMPGDMASGSGVESFLDLSDTPTSYEDQGSKYLAVNSGETGVEFVPAPGVSFSGVRVYRDDEQAIPRWGCNVNWDAEDFDTDSYHAIAVNNDRIKAPKDGYYFITTTVEFYENPGEGKMLVYVESTPAHCQGISGRLSSSSSVEGNAITATGVIYMEKDDYITVNAYHEYDGDINLVGYGNCTLSMCYLGA